MVQPTVCTGGLPGAGQEVRGLDLPAGKPRLTACAPSTTNAADEGERVTNARRSGAVKGSEGLRFRPTRWLAKLGTQIGASFWTALHANQA